MVSAKKIPQRKCVGCREMKDKSLLVRIVASATGNISLDATGKAHGRGAYLCKSENCLTKSQKSKGLERSLKRGLPQEIYDSLKIEISK